MKRRHFVRSLMAVPGLTLLARAGLSAESHSLQVRSPAQDAIVVGSERQLFLDDLFFASQDDVTLTWHKPVLQGVVIKMDQPWEQKCMHYPCVIHDGGRYRMWYRVEEGDVAVDRNTDRTWQCYAESHDGVHWEKPKLGLVSREGSKENNIVSPNAVVHGMYTCVMLDSNPTCSSGEKYKMIAGGVWGYVSEDGLRWRSAAKVPLMPRKWGPYDSQNVVMWNNETGRYVMYLRGVDTSIPGPVKWDEEMARYVHPSDTSAWHRDKGGRRAIRRSESLDFLNWSRPELVLWGDNNDRPDFHMYTNAAVKYSRAANAYLMFPMILYVDRKGPGAPYKGVSDVVFATSRDGVRWERRFRRSFLEPGLDQLSWVDRNPIMGVGILQTSSTELSMYYSDFYRSSESCLCRCTFRPDGFVSVRGPYTGWGEFVTPPLIFHGRSLNLNYSTSGGGGILLGLLDEDENPISGFSLDDCVEIFGDKIGGSVVWKSGGDVGKLAGHPVRLRVKLRDADLYAFQFRSESDRA